ncbi:MAG: hypothetical protein OXH57_11315 [Ekhidna sp.]|nr:hypothetical protein [Ekhidna sp.]
MFYAIDKNREVPREKLEDDCRILHQYLEGVQLARKGEPKSIESFKSVPGIGPSYASKHSYFWSLHSETPLKKLCIK